MMNIVLPGTWLMSVVTVCSAAHGQCTGWSPDMQAPSIVGDVGPMAVYQGGLDVFGHHLSGHRVFLRWDGATWTSISAVPPSNVRAAAVFDDGSGSKLFAVGEFLDPGTHIARWDGASWSSIPG